MKSESFQSKTRAFWGNMVYELGWLFVLCGLLAFPAVGLAYEKVDISAGLLAVPFFCILVALRYSCKNFILFFLLHILLPFPWLYLFRNSEPAFFAGMLVFCLASVIFSFRTRLGREKAALNKGTIIFAVIAFICIDLLLFYVIDENQKVDLAPVHTILAAGLILCYLIQIHLLGIESVVNSASGSSLQPAESIFRFNNRLLAASIGILALFMLFFRMLPIGFIGTYLLRLVKTGLTWFFSYLGSKETPPVEPLESLAASGQEPLMPFDENMPVREPFISPWVYTTVVMAALIAGLLYGVFYLLRNMYRKFGEKREDNGDIKEFISVRQEKLPNSPSFFGFFQVFGKSNNQRARKIFYRKIRAVKEEHTLDFLPSDTPLEMWKKTIPQNDPGNQERIVAIYEKARYGRNEISDEDLLEMKMLNKR